MKKKHKITIIILFIALLVLTGGRRYAATSLVSAIRANDNVKAKRIIEKSSWEELSLEGEMPRGVSQALFHMPTYTPFELACRNGNTEIAELLIQKGADVNRKEERYALTPIEHALWSDSETRYETAWMLIEKGANINVSNARECPLSLCLRIYDHQTDRCTEEGMKLFYYLYENTQRETEELNKIIDDLLILAVREGNIEAVRFLIEDGYDVNYVSEYGNSTALTAAAGADNTELVRLLLENGADKTHKNNAGHDAEYYARENANEEMLQLLSE